MRLAIASHVLPNVAALYLRYQRLMHSEFCGDYVLRTLVRANSCDQQFRQLRVPVAAAHRRRAVLNLVGCVFPRRDPTQVPQTAVGAVAIKVRALVAGWSGAEKRHRHQSMHRVWAGRKSVKPKVSHRVSSGSAGGGAEEPTRQCELAACGVRDDIQIATQAPKVGHRVASVASAHILPFFNHEVQS